MEILLNFKILVVKTKQKTDIKNLEFDENFTIFKNFYKKNCEIIYSLKNALPL